MQPNPTNDRLSFILKTYGTKYPGVVVDVVDVVARTVGEDRWVQVVADAATKAGDEAFFKDLSQWASGAALQRDVSLGVSSEFAQTLVAMVNELPTFRRRHRADPVFPWIARELVEVRKEELAKRDPRPGYRQLLADTKRRGTVLAQWYERTRPNLGEWRLSDALVEAKEWDEEHGPLPQGEIVAELSDGWTAQKLTTQECLSAEGERMQHCVASYGPDVRSGRTIIYSLRDANGHPHVTIEVKNGRVQQTQGKQNEKPAEKYQKYVDEFYAWLEENNVSTEKYPKHLIPYVEALEEHGHLDYEEDQVEWIAKEWEEVGSPERMEEWLKAGFSASDARIAGALVDEDVTPEEWAKFPSPIHYKFAESGEPLSNADDLIAVARMAVVLKQLAPSRDATRPRDELYDERQGELRFGEEEGVRSFRTLIDQRRERLPGHDPIEKAQVTRKWRTTPELLHPSISFETWSTEWNRADDDADVEWLYPAEEWIAEFFTHNPDDDEYVGPWFLHWFTPESATEWREAGVESGDLAWQLRRRRVTPSMIRESSAAHDSLIEFDNLRRRALKTAEYFVEKPSYIADMKRYTAAIADQIAEQLTAAGLRPNKKRTSKRTSRRRVSR